MRVLVALVGIAAVAAGACTKPNPDFCCTTEAQCNAYGADELKPCPPGQACTAANACVTSECETSADCTTAGAPVCIDQLCVGSCAIDDHCNGLEGRPYCASDGVCVGCSDAMPCTTTTAPICDAEDRACRGCEVDAECATGICLEAEGRCASEHEVVFVTQGANDAGECPRAAPCGSLTYALTRVTSTRGVVRVDGGFLSSTGVTTIGRTVYIDGTGTSIGPLAIQNIGTRVVLSHLRINSTTMPAITASTSSALLAHDLQVTGDIFVSTATIDLLQSTFMTSRVDCMAGTVTARQSLFRASGISSQNCQLTVRRNRFETDGMAIFAERGFVTVENNLLEISDGFADAALVEAAVPGSTVRFNTFVNTTSVPSDGIALSCDSTVDATSNIFAYSSEHPHSHLDLCVTRYSLYDTVALPAQAMGDGNVVVDGASIFLNRQLKDYRLAPGSAARMAAQPGLMVDEDLEGSRRPLPVGTTADIGALEASD